MEGITTSRKLKVRIAQQWENFGLLFILIIILAIFSSTVPSFRTSYNLISVLKFSSFVGIGAIGMAFCIMSGDFDISVGSMLGLVGILGSSFIPVIGGVGGVLSTIIIASLLGFINGIFITKLRIPAFITTLGMLYIFRALAFLYTENTPVYIQDRFWIYIGNGKVFGFPFAILLMLLCYAGGYLLLRRSPFGRYIVAVGTNRKAARLSGINVDSVRIIVFTLVGFFVGISSVVVTANLGSANPGMLGQGYEFQVITAVVLGGTLLGGGNGSLGGLFIAAIIITALKNGLGLMQVDSYWQNVATGLVLIFAVALNRIRYTLLGHTE
ncbi:MAG: ABC transporter permease [Actinomycetota bacterium]